MLKQDFPGGSAVKNLPANAGDTGLIPGPGRSHIHQGSQARALQPLTPVWLETALHNTRNHSDEKPEHCHEDQAQPKMNKINC